MTISAFSSLSCASVVYLSAHNVDVIEELVNKLELTQHVIVYCAKKSSFLIDASSFELFSHHSSCVLNLNRLRNKPISFSDEDNLNKVWAFVVYDSSSREAGLYILSDEGAVYRQHAYIKDMKLRNITNFACTSVEDSLAYASLLRSFFLVYQNLVSSAIDL